MILRGVGVRILAEDVGTLYDFYTEKLGFKVTWGDRNGAYISFSEPDNEEVAIALFAKSSMHGYKEYVPISENSKSDQVVCCTGADDVDAMYLELKGKGVEFIGEPRDIPEWFMRCVYFRDPEGNLFELSGAIKQK